MAEAHAPDLAPDTFTVGQLNLLIRHALAVTFPDEVWVQGEISGLRRHEPTGNVYFTLVDAGDAGDASTAGGAGRPIQADATLSVSLPRATKDGVNRLLRRRNPGAIRMVDGVHLRIRGVVEYYPPQGKLQLRMTGIDPEHTLGRLMAERDRVLAALLAEGLVGANAARPFPRLPLRLGLVTSPGSAAHADLLEELRASGIGWQITFAPARVQGVGADREVAAALAQLDRLGLDVVALVRGGGARTDLMTFDSEPLARTIAAMRTPVVAGIGHEIDSSVADQVVARSFKTPTACAAGLVALVREEAARAEDAWRSVADAARTAIAREQRRVQADGRHVAAATRSRLRAGEDGLAHLDARIRHAATAALTHAGRRVDTCAARAAAVDPARALERGWSITRTADGRVVRAPDEVEPGDELVTTLAGGTLASTVVSQVTDIPEGATR